MSLVTESFTADGLQRTFTVSNDILSKSHCRVHFYYDDGSGVATDHEVPEEEWDLLGLSTVVIKVPPVSGYVVKITTSSDGTGLSAAPSEISAVASNIDAIIAVSQNEANINLVGTNVADVNTTATNIADVNTIATNIVDVNTTATNIADVNTTATNIADVNTTATNIADVNTIATNIVDVNTTATNIADVNTTATNIVDVNTTATNIADINAIAPYVGDVHRYALTYLGAFSTAPTTRNDGTALLTGDIYFDSNLNEMRVYDGAVWKSAGSTVNGTAQRQTFTATAGQTTFTITGGYDATFADVYLNGSKLVNGVDVDVTSGTDVVLATGASDGDIVDVVAYGAFEVANTYTKAEIDDGYATKTLSTTADLDVMNKVKNVDGAGSGLDADTVDGIQGALLGVGGAGYSWVDETANRAAGTTYTNTTGKPIGVSINCSSATNGDTFYLYVDGALIQRIRFLGTTTDYSNLTCLVPSGSTYNIVILSGTSILEWSELK